MEGDDEAGLSIDVPVLESAPMLRQPQHQDGAEWHEALTAADTGPFATLSTGTTAWSASFNDGDVTMATASPGRDSPMTDTRPASTERTDPGRITNAPALSAAPRYAGSTMKDGQIFMHAYEAYSLALSAFDTDWLYRGENMPDDLLVRVPEEAQRNEWIAFFLQAREPELRTTRLLKNLKKWLIFPDMASRMGQLCTDMHRILDQYTVEQVVLERKQKKKLLEYTQRKELKMDIVTCYA
ncbi:LOW QUALITY PROTEIN: hypothetical protein PHMEG_00020434 [Phytophthora megakarya]|uniref:Uncharacterized protein n=1 Tax=Phytophthora megakarya TaxID=4795 RepID=A0A225VNS5_9STRA|nr:LOW QUALITY PROTEIN: hypothetical protein PHMEG_00020434 [Phytophthora megakarya]